MRKNKYLMFFFSDGKYLVGIVFLNKRRVRQKCIRTIILEKKKDVLFWPLCKKDDVL